jgi:pimeloyl-ACP methyl ester carboxylesterase
MRKILFLPFLFLSISCQALTCDKEDFSIYISGKNECLVMKKFGSDNPKVILIWLHGDISSGGPANYHFRDANIATSKLKDFSPLSAALVRPGYNDGSWHTSSVAEGHGARHDHYTKVNITEVASAIDNLKSYYKPQKTILIGHSGGAAYAANIIGMFPDTAQGAVLVSCPCDLKAWRSGRHPWTASEDPTKWISFIKSTTQVVALTGDGDTNTLPKLAESYVAQLVQRGIQAEFTLLSSTPHNGALASNDVISSLSKMIGKMEIEFK